MTEETQPSRYTVVAWGITALLLLLVLRLELVVAFLAGLLVYEIVRVLAPRAPALLGALAALWAPARRTLLELPPLQLRKL